MPEKDSAPKSTKSEEKSVGEQIVTIPLSELRPFKDHPFKVRDDAYNAELLIRNASDGKKYLYDIVSINENTASALDLLQKETRKGSHEAAARSSVSKDSMRQEDEKAIVNFPSRTAGR